MLNWIALAVVMSVIALAVLLLVLEHEFAAPLIVTLCVGFSAGYGVTILTRWLGLKQLLFAEIVQVVALSIVAALVCLVTIAVALRRRKSKSCARR